MQQRLRCAMTAAATCLGIANCVSPHPQVAAPVASAITVRCDTTAGRAACGDTAAMALLQRTLADTGQMADVDRLLKANQTQVAALERVLADSTVFTSLQRMLADTLTFHRILADSATNGLMRQLERQRTGTDSLRRSLDSLLEKLPRTRPDSGSR